MLCWFLLHRWLASDPQLSDEDRRAIGQRVSDWCFSANRLVPLFPSPRQTVQAQTSSVDDDDHASEMQIDENQQMEASEAPVFQEISEQDRSKLQQQSKQPRREQSIPSQESAFSPPAPQLHRAR